MRAWNDPIRGQGAGVMKIIDTEEGGGIDIPGIWKTFDQRGYEASQRIKIIFGEN